MNWKIKAALHHAFNIMPFGDQFYYWIQKYVTRSLSRRMDAESSYFKDIHTHLEVFKASPVSLDGARYYEFGAGWDLFQNILFMKHGMREQHLVDIKSLARADLINAMISYVREHPLKEAVKRDLPFVRQKHLRDDLAAYYGIYYRAPMDAQKTIFQSESMDFIATTHTLEHIPYDVLKHIMKECYRLSHDETRISMIIDYQDHFSYADARLTPYNFMQYSKRAWCWFNPSNHYQNRLRHSDYKALFMEAGFDIEHEVRVMGENVAINKNIRLHPDFLRYPEEDLLTLQGHFALRKKKRAS
ncbi:MAG: hypothetical protein ACTHJ4_07975 [Candidatus Nucleicultricaceae bacterium]